ncbi:DUF2254 domain-containing protein [Arthrobacter sp. NicSoilB4]|uniref:DUF2254 domain-containing protein n=1 Tax=Arthrobacter sp. NicSoilB4 TaxID=2830997 RepID=UPI0021E1A6EC|nr:DUF2254 domain-containing protein [Arthrobacter sp. NicSoilB4]
MANAFSSRGAPRRLLRARRRLRAGLAQLCCSLAGLALGLALPRVSGGPTVEGNRLSELLFTLGIGVIGVISIVFALLFGVVQWSASSFSPRWNLFHGDPLVWRTFALAVAVFTFAVTAGVVSINLGEVTALVPVTALLATLVTFALIRALQIRAFLSLKLPSVLEAVTSRGRAVIAAVYPLRSDPKVPDEPSAQLPEMRRTITWTGVPGVVQQLELRRLIDEATRADALVVFCVGVGDTVHDDSPLAGIHGGELSHEVVRAAVVLSAERTFDQDPTLALRLLADIALRALSPSVNDPRQQWTPSTPPRDCCGRWRRETWQSQTYLMTPALHASDLCCPSGRTTCASQSRICCNSRRRSPWCSTAFGGCWSICSRSGPLLRLPSSNSNSRTE